MTKRTQRKDDVIIGIDVDKNSFLFTVKEKDNIKRTKKIASKVEYLYKYIKNNYANQNILCAYEAGPTGYHVYDYLKERSIRCVVIPPATIAKAPNEKVKTNRLDSLKIVKHIMTRDYKEVRVPEGKYRELRYLLKIRENYVKNRRAIKQRIKAMLLFSNLYRDVEDGASKWSGRYIEELKRIKCSEQERYILNTQIKDLEYVREQTAAIIQRLKDFSKGDQEIKEYMSYLQSIPGIGFITAITILGRIGDPKELKGLREIGAFMGLVPREHSTGEKINKGSITHLGNKVLRSLIIEAAWIAIRRDVGLRQFYYRIKSRHHPRIATKKAIVAVGRKMTHIIYRVLKDKRKYIEH